MTVLTRNELEKLSKEEVIDDLFTINSIYEELANLSSTFDEFLQNIPVWNLNLKCQKYSRMKSELEVSKNYTKPLSKKMRYCTLDSFVIPENTQDTQLGKTICKHYAYALCPTSKCVSPEDLEACHRVRRKNRVIVKFYRRKKK